MAKELEPCVYILASKRRGIIYVGVTSNLIQRIWNHKHDVVASFTQRYQVHRLVYFERHSTMNHAISREKQLKGRSRQVKVALIESVNPEWRDLYGDLI